MGQNQAANRQEKPKMDFSQMTTLALTDHLHGVLDRSRVLSEIIEVNSLEGVEGFETLSNSAIASIAWQIAENLDIADDLQDELWNRFRLVSGQYSAA